MVSSNASKKSAKVALEVAIKFLNFSLARRFLETIHSKKYLVTDKEDVTRELMIWSILSGRFDKLEQIVENEAEPLKTYVAAAVMCKKCAPICKQYGLNGIVGQYEDVGARFESKATDMLNRISQENGELALLLIRRKMPLLGRRSVLDVANYGELQDLMACEPIQEMITKMWFGGLEPEGRWGPLFAAWLLPPIVRDL